MRRDAVASGQEKSTGEKKFPSALRLRELVWDHELAYLAYELTKLCKEQKDVCATTFRFPEVQYSITKSEVANSTAKEIIKKTFSEWMDAKKLGKFDGDELSLKETLREE